MKIDGKAIAASLFTKLSKTVQKLQKKGITPHVAILLVGNDQASAAYVRQKELKASAIGAKATIYHLPEQTTEDMLLKKIQALSIDPTMHGIIVQRPLPKHINPKIINDATDPTKDIDAFCNQTLFDMPLAKAVFYTLEHIYYSEINKNNKDDRSYKKWLQTQSIIVIGKGETGGGPTIALLQKQGCRVNVIDSKTKNPEQQTKQADIIISTVGKEGIITASKIKKGVILLGVGMYRGTDGKLHGDYEEADIQNVASYYTPIPGGIGPINVAMLLQNLVYATEKQTSS